VDDFVTLVPETLGIDPNVSKKFTSFICKSLVALHQSNVFQFIRQATGMLHTYVGAVLLIPRDKLIQRAFNTGPSNRHISYGDENRLDILPLRILLFCAYLLRIVVSAPSHEGDAAKETFCG